MQATIIIPTYNEHANIHTLIVGVRKEVPEANILVVDDNSPDGTGNLVREIMQSDKRLSLLARSGKGGLGAAYIAGFRHVLLSQRDGVIVMMDADLSHNPIYLPEMLKEAKTHDVVLGSRYVKGGRTQGWEPWRRALSYFGNLYASKVAGLPVHDCTGGFNVISIDRIKQIDFSQINVTGYAFIMGLKFLLFSGGAKFKEVPIVFKNRVGGESKMSGRAIARYFNEGILEPWKMRFKMKPKSV